VILLINDQLSTINLLPELLQKAFDRMK